MGIEGSLGDRTDGCGKELNVVRVRRRQVSGLSSRVMRTIHAGGRVGEGQGDLREEVSMTH